MADDEIRRVAVHEAGHCVAAFRLGFRGGGPVSVQPGRAYGAICFPGRCASPSAADLESLGRPGPLLRSRLRRWAETNVMVDLAGSVAADLFARRPGRCLPSAAELAGDALKLPARQARMLATSAAGAGPASDADQAAELLRLLHGDAVATAEFHLRYLESETRDLLAASAAEVRALADELAACRVLPASRWRAVLAGAR